MNFKTFLFHPQLSAGISAAGYSTPTPIQAQAIPKILQGRDLVGLAQTGTGKTAAFVLPILQRLMHGQRRRLHALILSPTRELAEQTRQAIANLGAKTGIQSTSVYGGVGMQRQVKLLKSADIVVACPGRLIDHINRQTIDLSSLEVLVLDEADRMLDMGFLPDIRRILTRLPQTKRQTLLFSATMPKQIQRLAGEILKNPERVQVAHDMPAETVNHTFFPVAKHLKTALLLKLLGTQRTDAVLIFTRTKHRARQLGGKLTKLGFSSTSLQGNLSQAQRLKAMNGFKSGKYQILVATDIAARGIDVSDVSHVINFDMPSTPETYIHRIGRTGRAECSGEAFTLFSREDKQFVGAIRRTIGRPVVERTLEGFDYNTPVPNTCNQRRRPKPRKQSVGNANRSQKRRAVKGAFASLSPRRSKMVSAL
ncbi:MAG: DEAD/DEAH box helicase [Desulfobacteraceae bacterium]